MNNRVVLPPRRILMEWVAARLPSLDAVQVGKFTDALLEDIAERLTVTPVAAICANCKYWDTSKKCQKWGVHTYGYGQPATDIFQLETDPTSARVIVPGGFGCVLFEAKPTGEA